MDVTWLTVHPYWMDNGQNEISRRSMQIALDHMRYAFGVLHRTEECSIAAGQLEVALSSLTEELARRAHVAEQTVREAARQRHLRLADV